MDKTQTEEAGRILWEARQGGQLIESLPAACRPPTVAEGYEVQDALAAHAGIPVAGFKIGATNKKVQARFGVDTPFSGRLFKPFVSASPMTIPAGAVNFYLIEAEFDFVMGATLAPRAQPYTMDEARAAVATVHPAIEVPDSRYVKWSDMTAPDLISDNAIGCFLSLGPPAAGGLSHDLAGQAVTIRVNGEVASEGSGAEVLGDPWNVLVWLANNLSARGIALEQGHVVTTGSAADVVICKAGDTVTAEFGPIGSAEVTFAS